METVTEVTDNGPKTYDRKVFPGYVLVKMIMTDEAWYIIKNVRGVTGFVGSGTKPTPLTEEEVAQLGVEKHEIVVNYDVGDNVKINDGPLTSFIGVVDQLEVGQEPCPASSSPCLAARPPWSWSWIRGSRRALRPPRRHRGRGVSSRQNTTLFQEVL